MCVQTHALKHAPLVVAEADGDGVRILTLRDVLPVRVIGGARAAPHLCV